MNVGARVLVGRGKGVLVRVARGALVPEVNVTIGIREGVCVGVREGVRVTVDVSDGVFDGVEVGAVDVGNGPSRACEVSAIAVRVPLDVRPVSRMPRGISKMLESPRIKPIDNKHINKAFR